MYIKTRELYEPCYNGTEMKALVHEKERAIALRRQGMSYKDILAAIPVAKSSLSLWLKDLPLTKEERISLKKRKNGNITRGRIKAAGVLHQNRLDREAVFLAEARKDFIRFKESPLFHAGVALYWAEGSKRVNQWSFTNSDEEMNLVILLWIEEFLHIPRENLKFRLYIHKLYAHENCEVWWQNKLRISATQFGKTIYKPSGRGIKKRPNYKGCLRIEMPKSKGYLLKMKFWQRMLVDCYKKR